MNITTDNLTIDASRLCDKAEYARFKDVAYTTVTHRILNKHVLSVMICNTEFIILPKEDIKAYTEYRKKLVEESKVNFSDY